MTHADLIAEAERWLDLAAVRAEAENTTELVTRLRAALAVQAAEIARLTKELAEADEEAALNGEARAACCERAEHAEAAHTALVDQLRKLESASGRDIVDAICAPEPGPSLDADVRWYRKDEVDALLASASPTERTQP